MQVRSKAKSDWSKTTKTNLGQPQNNAATTEEESGTIRCRVQIGRPHFSLFQVSTLKLGVLIARIQTSKRKPKEKF